jgi:transposase
VDGVVDVRIFRGSITGRKFYSFIDGLLDEMNPWPQPKSVIVLDNASIHKGDELRRMVEQR